ncbi:MAG: sulfotransferase [Candidatus Dormibacterales bacterium]
MRVLYIAGTGRSGSTLLAGLLGQVEGMVAPGELRFFWERGLHENRLCGCGRRFRDCPVWNEILEAAFGADAPDALAAVRGQARVTRIRSLPLAVLGGRRPELLRRRMGAHAASLSALYAAIAGATGARVIVDSSKLPSYGRALEAVPGVEVFVLHLVRDPRATAYSWSRVKNQPDRGHPAEMQRQPPAKAALLWLFWNGFADAAWSRLGRRYVRVRYEDFVADPTRTLRSVAELVGLEAGELDFVDGSAVRLHPNHSVAGNPDRLRHGPTRLRADSEWVEAMPAGARRMVTLLTLPLLRRYGYPLRAASPPAGPRGDGSTLQVQSLPGARRLAARIRRHYRWAREEGLMRVVEEDQLLPAARVRDHLVRRRWRRLNPLPPGGATPVFMAGLQRSGTNMLARALLTRPEFEVRNENDRGAFERFRLRDDEAIRALVGHSRQRYVLFKALIDSHRLDHLLDGLGTAAAPLGLWVVRSVDGRTRSALSKFGDNNLRALRAIAEGRGESLWQASRLSQGSLDLIRSQDYGRLDAASAAALFWYVRNSLFFELGLDARADVLLVSYDRLLASPGAQVARVCEFLGLTATPEMWAAVEPARGAGRSPLDIDPQIRRLCKGLEARFEAAEDPAVRAAR